MKKHTTFKIGGPAECFIKIDSKENLKEILKTAKENSIPFGVDFSSGGVQFTKELLAKNGYPQYSKNILCESLVKLPFENEMFDGIICYGVLYYLSIVEIRDAISEIYRTLKKGGKAYIVVRNIFDYRFNCRNSELMEEKNTISISEFDESKCANSENGMKMHFFEETELRELFCNFNEVMIDRITETHENNNYADDNYVVICTK